MQKNGKNRSLFFTAAVVLIGISVLSYCKDDADTKEQSEKPSSEYQTISIGSQEWMTKNLNVSTFRNGDAIPEVKTAEEWLQISRSGGQQTRTIHGMLGTMPCTLDTNKLPETTAV